jgi:hypothetical protein
MAKQREEVLKLPDQLLVRYFRAGEIEAIKTVDTAHKDSISVTVKEHGGARTDRWRDLGGGLGYVPAE